MAPILQGRLLSKNYHRSHLGTSIQSQQGNSPTTKMWYLFCQPKQINPLCPTLHHMINFLTEDIGKDLSQMRTTLNWILHHDMAHQVSMSKEVVKLCSPCEYNKPCMPWLDQKHVWKTAILLLLVTGKCPSEIKKLSLHSHRSVFTISVHNKTSWKSVTSDGVVTIRCFVEAP